MHDSHCHACGEQLTAEDLRDASHCPACGAALRPLATTDDPVIEVEAEVVGGLPRDARAPLREDVDGGPRVYTQTSEGPWGTFRSTTVVMGRDVPGGPNCCGFGCLLFVALMAVIFLRGCMSFF